MITAERAWALTETVLGGGFAGAGCGALAAYGVIPLVIEYAAGGQYPGKSEYVWLFLMCVVGGSVAGAGVGVIVALRRLQGPSGVSK